MEIVMAQEIYIRDFGELLHLTEELASMKRFIYRGHSSPEYQLKSTIVRFLEEESPDHYYTDAIKQLMLFYTSGVLKLDPNLKSYSVRDLLELARHDGLPSPLIDFTYSPYVALYFAFRSIRDDVDSKDESWAVLNKLDYHILGRMWSEYYAKKMQQDTSEEMFSIYMQGSKTCTDNYLPVDCLSFYRFPSIFNNRMLVQKGCFIYDGLLNNYFQNENAALPKFSDYLFLEKFIYENEQNLKASSISSKSWGHNNKREFTKDYCLEKFFIHASLRRRIMRWLEGIGVTNTSLFMTRESVAEDAKMYASKAAYSVDTYTQLSESFNKFAGLKFMSLRVIFGNDYNV